MQQSVLALESDVSAKISRGDDLLVVDGPLRNRQDLPRILGYVKTHQKRYLPDRLYKVVDSTGTRPALADLHAGHAVERLYLVSATARAARIGLVRHRPDRVLDESGHRAAVELANISAVTLPRFASCAYKDPRAPQNLVPIAGLERRLRAMLGDSRRWVDRPGSLHRARGRFAPRRPRDPQPWRSDAGTPALRASPARSRRWR